MAADETIETERIERALEGVNAGYVAEMQERWLRDPASVDPEWRTLFEPAIPQARPPCVAPPLAWRAT
jgi:2-oxoglutarate dehydrogenase complex dehydrogenase (E1) component-like enzyme